jgi:hypothetical protein
MKTSLIRVVNGMVLGFGVSIQYRCLGPPRSKAYDSSAYGGEHECRYSFFSRA